MMLPRSSIQLAMPGRSHALLVTLICSVLAACSTPLPFAQESSELVYDTNGRVLDGRARGRHETGFRSASVPPRTVNAPVTAYQRDERARSQVVSSEPPVTAQGMASRWRPVVRADDQDGDGVIDSNDTCPGTQAYVTVDRVGCGLFDAVLEEVVFNSGSRWLSAAARGRLDQLAETLLAFPESRVQVRAHTDSVGAAAMNQQLSTARAESVVQYLRSRGVHARQLQAVGMGESLPRASNAIASGQQRNRRVDVVTLPDQDAGVLPEIASALPSRAVTLLASAEAAVGVHTATQEPVAARVEPSELVLGAAEPLVTKRRSHTAVMPLPQPGFAPGVSISGVVDGLSFAAGSVQLQDEAHGILDEVSRVLLENPKVRIVVMAHTDDSGDAALNLKLSQRRAQAVVAYLVAQGVAEERLEAEGYGELLPLVQNVTNEDRAINRRVEIRIQPEQSISVG